MSSSQSLANVLQQWARLPLKLSERKQADESLWASAQVDESLSNQDLLLVKALLIGHDAPTPLREVSPTQGDLVRALSLLVRGNEAVRGGNGSGQIDAVATIAQELDALVSTSLELAAFGVSTQLRSQALAWLVAHDGTGVSPTRIATANRLLELDPDSTALTAYVDAFSAIADAATVSGRADVWEPLVAQFLSSTAPRLPGDVSLVIAACAEPLIAGDSRWIRAKGSLLQSLDLIAVAQANGCDPNTADSLGVSLGLAFLTNRDLDERPLIVDVGETFSLMRARIAPGARGELIARFTLAVMRLDADPHQVQALIRSWCEADPESLANDHDAAQIVDESLFELDVRCANTETVRTAVQRTRETQGFAGAAPLIECIAVEAADLDFVTLLDELARATTDQDEALTLHLAALAVATRLGDVDEDVAARFESLGGISELESEEDALTQHLRFTIATQLGDSAGDNLLLEGVDPQSGVPLGLYSSDPGERLHALQQIRNSAAFLAAETADEEDWPAAMAILAEGYTRGVADPDEQVREASVILARRIIYWNLFHDVPEAVRWAQRVVEDTESLVSPRAVRARCLALQNIEQYSEDPTLSRAAASRLDRELEGNHADYAITLRTQNLYYRSNSQEPAERIATYERLLPMLEEAEDHDEYEQTDWNKWIRDVSGWLATEYHLRGQHSDATRCADIYLTRLPQGNDPQVNRHLANHFIKDFPVAILSANKQIALRAKAVISASERYLAERDPALLRRAQVRGEARAVGETWDQDRETAVSEFTPLLAEMRAIVAEGLDGEDSEDCEVLPVLVQWARYLFLEAEKWECGEVDGKKRPYTLTTRTAILYLRNGCMADDPSGERLVASMIRMAGSDDTFLTSQHPDEVAELYSLLEQHLDPERDAASLDSFTSRFQRLNAISGAEVAHERTRKLGLISIGVALVLAIVATLSLIAAPDGATIPMVSRRGAIQFTTGTWALFVPAAAALLVGIWARISPKSIGGTRGPRLMVVIIILAICAQVILAFDVLR